MSLWPNLSFLPKVVNPQTINQVIEISALCSESALMVDNLNPVSLCEGTKDLCNMYRVAQTLALPAIHLLWRK